MSPVWKSVKNKNLDHEASGGGGRVCVCVSKFPFAVPDIKLSKKQETSCFRDLRLHAQAPARRAVLASLRKGSKVAPFSLVALRLRPELWVPPAPGYQRCGSLGFGWVWHRVLLLSGTKLLPTGGGWRGRLERAAEEAALPPIGQNRPQCFLAPPTICGCPISRHCACVRDSCVNAWGPALWSTSLNRPARTRSREAKEAGLWLLG